MTRKFALAVLLNLVAASAPAMAASPRVVVLDFDLIDEMRDPATEAADRDRLAAASRQFPASVEKCSGIEIAPVPGAVVESVAAQITHVHQCNGCAEDIAKAAGADLVVFTWVQKVSNLILNVNAEVQDSAGRTLDVRSVDMRGNTSRSWTKAVDALANRLCDRLRR